MAQRSPAYRICCPLRSPARWRDDPWPARYAPSSGCAGGSSGPPSVPMKPAPVTSCSCCLFFLTIHSWRALRSVRTPAEVGPGEEEVQRRFVHAGHVGGLGLGPGECGLRCGPTSGLDGQWTPSPRCGLGSDHLAPSWRTHYHPVEEEEERS